MNPEYPIYIPSKGRWMSRLTVKNLTAKGVPFRVVVEPNEYANYAAVIEESKLLRLDENLSELEQGSVPVRNWIWNHALAEGHKRYWLIDDNISQFYRLNRNTAVPVDSGTIFRCVENFTDRYSNVAFSGMNHLGFARARRKSSAKLAPFRFNARIYSMTLINSAVPYRWRGRYNEDTDIILRALKDKWGTILFNAFLGDKAKTMKMKGGNTDTIYNTGDNRRAFAESLAAQHPDVARVTWKFNRWHHEVDYSAFKDNDPRLRDGLVMPSSINNYGMKLVRINGTAG